MTEDDDSITEPKDDDPGPPAYLRGHANVYAMREHADATASPVDRAIAAKVLSKRQPIPDAAEVMQQQIRSVPKPPVDLLNAGNAEDYDSTWLAPKLAAIHQDWLDIASIAADRSVPVEKLHSLGSKVLEKMRAKISEAKAELNERAVRNAVEAKAKLLVRVDPALASDIRRAFVERVKKDGAGATNELLKSDVVASAVLSAPGLVFGLSEEKMAELYDLGWRKHQPDSYARRNRINALLSSLERAENQIARFGRHVERWTPRAVSAAMQRLTAAT